MKIKMKMVLGVSTLFLTGVAMGVVLPEEVLESVGYAFADPNCNCNADPPIPSRTPCEQCCAANGGPGGSLTFVEVRHCKDYCGECVTTEPTDLTHFPCDPPGCGVICQIIRIIS